MKKLMSLVLCVVMLMSMTVCALAADGTFTGEGAGKGGMINVEVTVQNGEIALELLIQTHEGSRFRWRRAFELSKLPADGNIGMGTPVLHRGY